MDKKIRKYETKIGKFYDNWWPELSKFAWYEKTYGLHLGFFEDGIKTYKEAILNMNNLVGRLLDLETNKPMKILDAGCGVGGTSIYLANKYPNVSFTGITIAPKQVKLAEHFSKESHVANTKFKLASYINTGLPDNYFDGIFALESVCYTQNIIDFINEMHRILKPGGRLVAVDLFRTDVLLNPIMQIIYNEFCKGYRVEKFPIIKDYKIYLKKKGFIELIINDISKNVSSSLKSMILLSFLAVPYDLYRILKVITYRLYNKHVGDFVIYSKNAPIIPACILGLSGAIKYYTTIAIKK